MAVEMKPEWNAVIDEAYVVWFTTVRADGMPQPTPVWFIKDGDTFLIYSVPDNQKLRNIQQNSKVRAQLNCTMKKGHITARNTLLIIGCCIECKLCKLACDEVQASLQGKPC